MQDQDILKVQDPKHIHISSLNTVEECEYIQARLEESKSTIELQLETIEGDRPWRLRAQCALHCVNTKLVEVQRKRRRLLSEIEAARRERIEFQFMNVARNSLDPKTFEDILSKAKEFAQDATQQ